MLVNLTLLKCPKKNVQIYMICCQQLCLVTNRENNIILFENNISHIFFRYTKFSVLDFDLRFGDNKVKIFIILFATNSNLQHLP